ncbi:MAG: hypothetical protein ACRCY8_16390 [Dermatophilaceae bacterium]
MTRRTLIYATTAVATLVIELGSTYGTITGEPFAPVPGWGPTRPADLLAFALVALGSAPIALFPRFPVTVGALATGSYLVYAMRDYELGMFLPPMVVLFALVARTRHRLAASSCMVTGLGAALVWVADRAVTIGDSGTRLLTWVAFGTVLGVFFTAPVLLGEIVRVRSLLRVATAQDEVFDTNGSRHDASNRTVDPAPQA